MRIVISLEQADARHWLLPFAAALTLAGHTPSFRVRPSAGVREVGIKTLLFLESRLFGDKSKALSPIALADLPLETAEDTPEIVIEISGDEAGATPDLMLFLDGKPGIRPIAMTLVSDFVPFVELRRPSGEVAVSGLPGIEEPDIATRALDHFFRRLATLFLMALDGKKREKVHLLHHDKVQTAASPLRFLAWTFIRKIAGRLFPAHMKSEHWRVGIRPARAALDIDADTPIDGFSWLADDGERFYADPVLLHEAGKDYLFVEEYPYTTQRGIISYTELDAAGRALFTPRPVIERSTHLSYPLMFRHDGEIYMIPENSAENHVPLYRARNFPDDWEHVGPLVPDIGLHDATLFEHDGIWWLFGNEARQHGSSWDCLMIFHARSPLGPFEPHALNPVMVDARVARPGGPVLRAGGSLIRPVQSCLGGYGRFIRFVEIVELTPETYRQRERGRMLAPHGGPVCGVHTYDRNDRFEAIDALAPKAFKAN